MSFRLCYHYLQGNCKLEENCTRLHICKNFLMQLCPQEHCKYGLRHEILDGNNLGILETKGFLEMSNVEIMFRIVEAFPRVCKVYEIECSNDDCGKLHICLNFLFNKCLSLSCTYSHNFKDIHNMKVFQSYGMLNLLKQRKEYIVANILVSELDTSPQSMDNRLQPMDENFEKRIERDMSVQLKRSSKRSTLFKELLGIITPIQKKQTKDNILSFLLNNFEDMYCSIHDQHFQSLFIGETEDIKSWLSKQTRYFRLKEKSDGNIIVIPCLADVEPCTEYWKLKSRCDGNCGKFHICKKIILNEVHNHNSCNYNHNFLDKHSVKLVKQSNIDFCTDEQILKLLQNRYPFICSEYQNQTCSEGEQFCSMIHVCRKFMLKKCINTEEDCELKHESAFSDDHAERISKAYHIPKTQLKTLCILSKESYEEWKEEEEELDRKEMEEEEESTETKGMEILIFLPLLISDKVNINNKY